MPGTSPTPAGVALRGPGYCAARAERQAFAGLPAPFRSKWGIVAALAAAGTARPIGDGAFVTFANLLARTPAAAWQAGGEPIVWLGTAELAGMKGCSHATLERHLAELEAAGLIERRYPNGRRLVSLAPAAAVALALLRANEAARERRRALARQAGAVSEIVVDLAGLRAHAEAQSRPAAEQAKLAELEGEAKEARAELRRLRRRDGAAGPLRRAEHERVALRCEMASKAALAAALGISSARPASCPSPVRAKPRMDEGPNVTMDSLKEIGITAWQGVGGEPWASRHQEPRPRGGLPASDAELRALSPWYARMREAFDDPFDAAVLAVIGRTACIHVGVPGRVFDEACARHGSTQVALACLAVLEKPAWQIRGRSRGAVLVGMLRKPPEALNPLASLHGYRAERCRAEAAAAAPDSRPGYLALP